MTVNPDDTIKPSKFKGETRYLTWMAESQIKRGIAPTNAYTTSAAYSGIMLAYNRTGDKRFYGTHLKFPPRGICRLIWRMKLPDSGC